MGSIAPRLAVPEVGEVIGGKYRIDRLIGRGGMGAVYAATHEVTGKAVAIKWLLAEETLDPQADERFVREARAAGRVRHPNVVDVYDIAREERGSYMVMELLEGDSLGAALAQGPVEPRALLAWLLPAMRGIAAAHRSGVVHRDLKPDNIFLATQPDGGMPIPKVLDFGISKVAHPGLNELTHSGTVMGTPRYMPAEQFKGAKNIDHRVDIYAIGVILYRGLTGRFPFTGENYGAMAIAVATAEVVRPTEIVPWLDPRLEEIVLRAMAREPHQRFSTMDELVKRLTPFAEPSIAGASLPRLQDTPAMPAPSSGFTPTLIKPADPVVPRNAEPVVPDTEQAGEPSAASVTPGRPPRVVIGLALLAGAAFGLVALSWFLWGDADAPATASPAASGAAAPPAPAPTGIPTAAPTPAPPVEAAPAPTVPAEAVGALAPTPAAPEAPTPPEAEPVDRPAPSARPQTARRSDDGPRATSTKRSSETTRSTSRRTGSISLDDF